MFEIESKAPDEVTLKTTTANVKFDLVEQTVDGDLPVGKIEGPGEFEIGDMAIRGIQTGDNTVYDVIIGNVHIGIIGGVEEAMALDELGVADILCTSSVRAVREIGPKVVIAMGNVDGMVTELKLAPRVELKSKVPKKESLPMATEVVALN